MIKKLGEVYETRDFGMFKVINGNRKDIQRRKNKVKKSVESVGYIPAPIIVNEKMEVIDGQARLAYCKEYDVPIAYFVVDGLTVDDCIAMNISATNWGVMDYISSYADRGYPSYVLATKLISNSPYSIRPSLWALLLKNSYNTNDEIQNGTLDVDEAAYERAIAIIEYWKRFDDIITNRKAEFLMALGYCYLMPEVDNELLVKKIHLRPRDFQMIANVTDAIDVIEDVYNVRNRNHVYIETEYLKYIDTNSHGGVSANIISKRKHGRRINNKA